MLEFVNIKSVKAISRQLPRDRILEELDQEETRQDIKIATACLIIMLICIFI